MTSGCDWGCMEEAAAPGKGASATGKLACGAMILQSFGHGFLPFPDSAGGFAVDVCCATAISSPIYGGQFIRDHYADQTEAKSTILEDGGPLERQFWTLDLLNANHGHADLLVHPCASNAMAPNPSSKQANAMPGRSHGSSQRLLSARSEQWLTYAVVVATLQLFLRLTGTDATAVFLPMLSQATGCRRDTVARIGDAVLLLVNAAGVLGSSLATRRYGREAVCAIGGALIVLCQVAVPTMMGAHAGLGGARTTAGQAAAMVAAACGVSGGFSWSWGALFWAMPGTGEEEFLPLGKAAGAALGVVQLQCFLLALRQLRHAAVAYYAVWIWS
ncbi:hypothetical protein ACP4OV_024462 [Aristida adscensionis]